jgi:dipeptidyl aminopeptidase/acylaminoacyl peptidase
MNTSGLIDLELLLRTPYIDPDLGFDYSPIRDSIAFSSNKTSTWQIYTLNLGDIGLSPRQITKGEGGKFAPRWRPGGVQLAIVLDADGSENYDLYLLDLDSGQQENLTPDTSFAISPEFSWSPFGNSIAFCADRDGCFHTFILNLQDRSFRKVLETPQPDRQVIWSPTGKHLAVVSEAHGQDHWITVVPLETAEPPWLVSLQGEPIDARHPSWSPDGLNLYFTSDHQGVAQVACLHLSSARISWITAGEGEKEYPHPASSGLLAYVISRGPTSRIAIHDRTTGLADTLPMPPGVVYHPKFDPSASRLFFIFDNPQHPCDLWVYSFQEKSLQQLTRSMKDPVLQRTLILPEEVTYPSSDGTPVPALLYLPRKTRQAGSKDVNPSPAVIYIHGGPNWLTQITWDPLAQHMVSRGWVVLAPNYRGSTGYGKAWQWANRFDLGGVDTQDVTSGADYLVSNRIADPDRIAVTGRSWGGYLTMTCLTQYPERWAAGSAVVPFLNWFTAHQNSRKDLQHWDLQNFGDPVSNQDLWYNRSPFFFLDRIQAPVQLICGANDIRCPASESSAAHETLKSLGKPSQYILYPDEGHAFLKIDNIVLAKQQQVAFLAKHLEKASLE